MTSFGDYEQARKRMLPINGKVKDPENASPKKGKKGKSTPANPVRIKRLVKWILPKLDDKKELPSDRPFDFFQSQILNVSAKLRLLRDVEKLNLAGGGTSVVTSFHALSKPTCNCRAQGIVNCQHGRIYAQPYCDSGSHREKYINGYHLCMINAYDNLYDLPLYQRLNQASCHDSIGFVISWTDFHNDSFWARLIKFFSMQHMMLSPLII